MQLPFIHQNGTSKEKILRQLSEALFTLDAAYEALKLTAPNGRDYYPIGPDALKTATQEHTNRLRKLEDVKQEISDMMFEIDQASSE